MTHTNMYLVRSIVNIEFIRAWGKKQNLIGPNGDLGYVMHGLLQMLFRKHCPQTFHLDSASGVLSFYTPIDRIELNNRIKNTNKEACYALGLSSKLEDYEFSMTALTEVLTHANTIKFELKTIPIKRLTGSKKEVDVSFSLVGPKEAIYECWLNERLKDTGVRVTDTTVAISRQPVMRKEKKTVESERRKLVNLDAKIVDFTGNLTFNTIQCLFDVLFKGVGRHKAFGHGMLNIKI